MLDRFTVKAGEALQAAERLAGSFNHSEWTALHLLAALVQSDAGDNGGIIAPLLEKIGASATRIRSLVNSEMTRRPKVAGAALTPDRSLQEVIQVARTEADQGGSPKGGRGGTRNRYLLQRIRGRRSIGCGARGGLRRGARVARAARSAGDERVRQSTEGVGSAHPRALFVFV